MRQAKTLVYEGLRHFAGGVRSGREGVLVDEELGTDVLHSAKSDGLVVLMPIEKSGLRSSNWSTGTASPSTLRSSIQTSSKRSSATTLSTMRPMRRTQVTRLATVSEWAERAERRWLIELLVPPTPQQLATYGDQEGFDRGARPGLTAEAIAQFQAGGVHPNIWKLEGYETPAAADVVLRGGGERCRAPGPMHCAGTGRPIDRVEHWLTVAAHRHFVGFAVGRTIWEEPLPEYLCGAISGDR